MSASRTRIMATCCRWQRRERTSRGKNPADYVRGQFLTVRPWTFPARQHFDPGASPGTIEAAGVPNRATGSSEARPDREGHARQIAARDLREIRVHREI